jgi:hypothetical protein
MITYQNQFYHLKNNRFALSLLKGRIGESVVETYLLASGYEVYPYGYENNYVNITRFVRKDQSDAITTKIRSMPDLLVCDPDNNERFLLQIKTTNTPDESSYWINKDDFESYVKYWSEALLVVYGIRTGKVYCVKIADINNPIEGPLPNTSEQGFFLNLADFHDFTKYFHSITPVLYFKLNKEITNVLNDFNPTSIRIGSKTKKVNDTQTQMDLELSP